MGALNHCIVSRVAAVRIASVSCPQGAARPIEENFVETPAGVAGGEGGGADGNSNGSTASGDARLPAYLEAVSKDEPIMMYCTGGIRCDIYSAYLRRQVGCLVFLGTRCSCV